MKFKITINLKLFLSVLLFVTIIFLFGCPNPVDDSNYIKLENDTWYIGNLDKEGEVWFYFDGAAGNTYDIYWDDSYEGSGNYICDIVVSAYKEDKTTYYFENADSAYNSPQNITLINNERVYIKVRGYSSDSYGDFAIKYNIPFRRVTNNFDDIQTDLTESFSPGESWTFMIYLDGDNNLEEEAVADFYEIVDGLNGLNNSNIKVIVLFDRIDGYDDSNFIGESSNWTGAKIFQIEQNNTYTNVTELGEFFNDNEEINMGDPQTLDKFIDYCKTNFSSSHYALILWNHGGGTRSKDVLNDYNNLNISKATCWDDSSTDISGNTDALYIDEVQQALANHFNSSEKLNFLGFDSCLMGMVEVAYEFKDYVEVLAGSMANEQGNGWDYKTIFSNMEIGSNDDSKELGKLIVKSYHDSTLNYSDQTLVAVDLTNINLLKNSIDNLATLLYQENQKNLIEQIRDVSYHFYNNDDDSISTPFYDLNDFISQLIGYSQYFSDNLVDGANAVINNLANIIIAAYAGENYGNYYGKGIDVKRGLSIFISRGDKVYYNGESNLTHYAYQWWYTNVDTASMLGSTYMYGKIDFCDSNNNGVVETWRELFEAWYDSDNNYTPSTY